MPPRTSELDLRAIGKRLEREGWTVRVATGDHDVYKHPTKPGRIPVPHGRGNLPLGTARSIAGQAGWLEQGR
ncbi:type II toxin-antitoxin system HicA family toxin [Methylobacterium trifolii]|uniref:Type II toxin-antitoxin system HicA family toxin n=1 Tax=Methylobacterium trifolii TaxID=1003092 RepID=A0ABQ4U637_9HYPH|nr:type II toxin-antitoxin system HicA family toxin [Methylobacterium trifolii]GJE61867.1 hypothetical protein MPOCJGCO_3993 [Methylobacterium trifolii]